jgi:PucR family transcriptional regulator, purine catabolism regulatory protein
VSSPARREAAVPDLGALGAITDAVESGLGLPEVVRAAARALDASLVLIDRSSAVLAVAARSTADERQLMSDAAGVETVELRVGDEMVGRLRLRARGGEVPAPLLRIASTLIASEVERVRAPDRASEAAQAAFLTALLRRRVTDRGDILARAGELGSDLSDGGAVVVVRAHHFAPADDGWRARVLAAAERAARAGAPGALAAVLDGPTHPDGHVVVLLPTGDDPGLRRVAAGIARELHASVHGFTFAVGHSRVAHDPVDLYRAGNEALLAANVATTGGEDVTVLAFEDTGAYRLLLPAMSEDPAELQRFYQETVAPLVAYDDQYETDLVQTLETFLDADGNVAGTAARLYTHRHTVRYRLERVRDLTGLDVSSTDGREKLGLGR